MSFLSTRSSTGRLTLTLTGAALAAAACGGGGAYGAAGATSTTAAQRSATATVALAVHHSSRYGSYLTDARGRTLYLFAADRPGHSVCTGSCATYWPPLLGTPKRPTSGPIRARLLSTTRRSGGTTQVTYAGHPLYHYVGDARTGDTKGEGLNLSGGRWWLVAPTGAAISTPTASSTPGSTGSTGSTGYGGYGGYGG